MIYFRSNLLNISSAVLQCHIWVIKRLTNRQTAAPYTWIPLKFPWHYFNLLFFDNTSGPPIKKKFCFILSTHNCCSSLVETVPAKQMLFWLIWLGDKCSQLVEYAWRSTVVYLVLRPGVFVEKLEMQGARSPFPFYSSMVTTTTLCCFGAQRQQKHSFQFWISNAYHTLWPVFHLHFYVFKLRRLTLSVINSVAIILDSMSRRWLIPEV